MTGNQKAKAFRAIAFGIGVLAILLAGTNRWLPAQQSAPQGPPQFTTYPIHDRMVPAEVRGGHVVYVPPVAEENIGHAGPGNPPGGSGRGNGGGGSGGDTPPPDEWNQPASFLMSPSCFPSSANVDATCAADSYQGEPMLAGAGTKLVGSENDIYPGNCSATAGAGTFGDCGLSASVSSNSGASWQRFKLTRTWAGHTFLIGFDPSAAFDSDGNAYVAYGVADGGASGPNGIVVTRLPSAGSAFVKANAVVLNLSGGQFEDKYWIAAGPGPGGVGKRLYVAWDRNKGNNQLLMVSFSSDQGHTWSAPKKINDGTSSFERVIYAFPAVAPNGWVYVLWHDYARKIIFMDKSTDGGNTWGTDVAVTSTNLGFGSDIGCNGGRSMAPAPQMAIASNGDIYVVYADKPSGAGTTYDVFVRKSTNGGASWSAAARVSSTSNGHQYNPAIAIGSDGKINISYLDRRDDASNCRTHTYLSRSTVAGGTSFTDTKVTDADSSFDGNPNGPGDYEGIATLGTVAHPYFSDHRSVNIPLESGTAGSFEIYTATVP